MAEGGVAPVYPSPTAAARLGGLKEHLHFNKKSGFHLQC